MAKANGTAVAAGTLVVAFVDMLVTKGVLERAEVGNLISHAFERLTPLGNSSEIESARDTLAVIAQMYAGHDN